MEFDVNEGIGKIEGNEVKVKVWREGGRIVIYNKRGYSFH